MEHVVVFDGFHFKYLRSGMVLKDINLEIEKGSFTVIIGPSGAGKTTLCKCITGILPFIWEGIMPVTSGCWVRAPRGRRSPTWP